MPRSNENNPPASLSKFILRPVQNWPVYAYPKGHAPAPAPAPAPEQGRSPLEDSIDNEEMSPKESTVSTERAALANRFTNILHLKDNTPVQQAETAKQTVALPVQQKETTLKATSVISSSTSPLEPPQESSAAQATDLGRSASASSSTDDVVSDAESNGKAVARKARKKTVSAKGEKRARARFSAATSARLRAKQDGSGKSAAESGAGVSRTAHQQADPDKRHKCLMPGCGLGFKENNERMRHMNTHFYFPEGATKTAAGTEKIKDPFGYKCPAPNCTKSYSRGDALVRHMDGRECMNYKHRIKALSKYAWGTESGCQVLDPPKRSDILYKRLAKLRAKYGLPPLGN